MKTLILLLLVAAVFTTGAFRSSRIVLQRNRKNTVNFACGAVDPRSGRTGLYRDSYYYTFRGYPSWMTARASYLVGSVPNNIYGDFPLSVNYKSSKGTRTGL